MLVLGRSDGEAVVITVPPSDQPQTIRVVLMRGFTKTRLGFECHRSVKIMREELIDPPAPQTEKPDGPQT